MGNGTVLHAAAQQSAIKMALAANTAPAVADAIDGMFGAPAFKTGPLILGAATGSMR